MCVYVCALVLYIVVVTASASFARKFVGIISSSSKFRNNEPHLTGIQIACLCPETGAGSLC